MNLKVLSLITGALIGISGVVNASTLLGTTTNPTGIDGLVVDGTTYNIAFGINTYNTFTAGSTLSKDAANALATALNALGVNALDGGPTESFADEFYLDAKGGSQDETQCLTSGASSCGAPWFVSSTTAPQVSLGQENPGNSYIEAAVFTPVPLPPSAWLMLSGLVGIGVIARRPTVRHLPGRGRFGKCESH